MLKSVIPFLKCGCVLVLSPNPDSRTGGFLLKTELFTKGESDEEATILCHDYLSAFGHEGGKVMNKPRLVATLLAVGDGFPQLSPDGKKIVFDSNRNTTEFPAPTACSCPTCT